MAEQSINVNPELIRWAVERSGRSLETLARYLPRIDRWESGEAQPTLKQLEKLARKTWTPLGYFFLAEPPEEKLPVPDFRTARDEPVRRPSPNLIDTLHTMQRRQAWMRDYLIEMGHLTSFIVEGANRLVQVLFKFVPLRTGVDELTTGSFTEMLGFGAALGTTLAVVRKIRTIAWVLAGTALLVRRSLRVRG